MGLKFRTPRHRPAPYDVSRAAALTVTLVLAASALALVAHGPEEWYAHACGSGAHQVAAGPGPLECAHVDEPPPGVDVTEAVSTAELRGRGGGGPMAYQAAEELGVPMAAATTATSPALQCDGDGASGYRVQAMYVVEAGRTNRFSSLLPSFKLWAAGVDDVFNRSAALTGGVRHVRYVTEPGAAGTCEAKVLNLTVPAGSMASFGATISAVQALGYADPTRKYLMWTDATSLCGIANLYPNDGAGQGNPNNGYYAQYARVDSGCWGFGDGSGGHSVEAHELVHTLGAVNSSAAHGTTKGHCWDESDTMCYADGGGHAMVQVCPAEREYLLDCNTDDYFSTFPDPGAYLDGHWNAANSRFLIGGGDGTGGGAAGSPTVLGATIGVNNPAVPGLLTQVEVTPVLPTGRTLSTVAWKSARADCVFSAPAQTQSDVTCAAGATGSTTVTATLVDSTGATKTITSPLTFATGTARPVTLSAAVDGQTSSPASVCTSAPFPLTASATDTATGLPVKGLGVSFTKKTPTMTAPAAAGAGLTLVSGVASSSGTATVTTAYAARTAAGAVFAAGTSATVSAVPGRCTADLTGAASTDELYYGESVTVAGTLTRTVNGQPVAVGGASLPVKLGWVEGATAKSATLATARTAANGSWSVVVKPTRTGALSASLAASTAFTAVSADLGPLTVYAPTTDLTASINDSDVGYGGTVAVTGRLTRTSGALTTGSTTTGLGSATVSVKVLAPGSSAATVVGTGRTLADGSYTVSLPLRLSGTMQVVYAGAAGLPADTVGLGSVTAGQWGTALTMSGSVAGTAMNLAGTLTKTYAGATSAAGSVPVKIYFTPTSTGVPALVSSTVTTSAGTFTRKLYPPVSGTYTARVLNVTGYANATSNGVGITRV